MRLVTRTEIGLDPVVRNANGTPRPALVGERWTTWHWPGTAVRYKTVDVSEFIRNLDKVMWANGKPNEYNYVLGPQDDGLVHEYAGGYAGAHSEGENHDSVGCLILIGMSESITDAQVVKYQWLRDRVLIPYGILRTEPEERPHLAMPGARTQCPGPTVIGAAPRLREPYIEPLPIEDDEMLIAIYRPADYAKYPHKPWFAASGGSVRPATTYDTQYATAHNIPTIDVTDPIQYDNLVRAAGLG
jgi:hypothetical protein